jgi:hypothetical protein
MLAPSIYALIFAAVAALASPSPSAAAESPCPSVLDHQFSNLRDEPVSLCEFRGKSTIKSLIPNILPNGWAGG